MRNIEILQPKKIEKGWGYELVIHNEMNEYCGKILHFNDGGRGSLHYHVNKKETFYVTKGNFILITINPDNGDVIEKNLNEGDVVEINRGIAHRLEALQESEIFEVSTYDDVNDSYRIIGGDTQNC